MGQPGPCTLEEISRIGGNVRERLSADMMLLIGQLRESMRSKPTDRLRRLLGKAHRLPRAPLRLLRHGA